MAKHKLVYPILSFAHRVPPDIPIVPVYLRASLGADEVRYHVVECAFPDPRRGVACLTDLAPLAHKHLSLPLAGRR